MARALKIAILGDASSLSRALNKANKDTGSFSEKAQRSVGAVSVALGNLAASGIQQVIGGVGNLVGSVVQASDATDKFKQTLKFAGLDNKVIKTVTAQTKKYADQTVYSLADIQNTTAQLASNGVPNYEKITEAAGNLNAVAGGNAETFKSVGMVLTQTAGAGKLTTENWNQLSDAIPGASGKIQQALQKNGAFTGNFRDAMAKGQITSTEFNKALLQLGTKPVAVNAAKSTKTFEGAIGNLQASIVSALLPAVDKIKPYFTKALGSVSAVIPKIVDGVKTIWPWVHDKLAMAFGAVKTAVEKVAPVVEAIFNFLKANPAVVKNVAIAVGILAGAMGTWAVVMGVVNAVMAVSPLTWILLGIIALVAGITLLVTHWKDVTAWLGKAWDKIKGFGGYLKDAFIGLIHSAGEKAAQLGSKIWSGIKSVGAKLLGFAPFILGFLNPGFLLLSPKVRGLAVKIGGKIWEGIKAIGSKLRSIGSWIWGNVYPGPLLRLADKVYGAAKTVGRKIWDGIKTIGKDIAGIATWFWNRERQGWSTIATKVWNAAKGVGGKIWSGIKSIGSSIAGIGSWLWGKVSGSFSRLKDRFSTTGKSLLSGLVNGLRNKWDDVKELTKKPLNFMIDVALNPFLKAVGHIPGVGGIFDKGLKHFAVGGRVFGAGTATSDSIPAMLSNGEHVLTAQEVKNAGGHGAIYRMRQLLKHGRVNKSAASGDLGWPTAKNGYGWPGFAKGGEISQSRIEAAKRSARAQVGKPYIWGAVGPNGYDCSGFMSAITNVLRGRNPYSRVGTSSTFPWSGFKSGDGQFTVGAFTGNPGHVAGTLDGLNVESTNGSVRVGSAARGAHDHLFTRRAHLGAGGSGFLSSVFGKFADGAAWFKDKVSSFLPKIHGGGLFSGSMLKTLASHIFDGIKKHVPGLATGGIVRATAGGTLTRLGEGGYDEAVIPLKGRRSTGGNTYVTIEVKADATTDKVALAKALKDIITTGVAAGVRFKTA